ncbi:hypothetical protein GLW04_07125 [Halobacillus litoralis]|uniref:Calcineurin-like phosphoesterase domain-containing protein n=1 Tax=Halobacillus litoralis TaxID=45668 RepID=A0A845E046_9BACI|nr:hypothetical protein [Halobacillus litoralis]
MRTAVFWMNESLLILFLSLAVAYTVSSEATDLEGDGRFKLVLLPDTQLYSDEFPDRFHAQTQWLADNFQREDIRFAAHLGDVVDKNQKHQWENADKAVARMDEAGVPYGIAMGNHDMGGKAAHFKKHFGSGRMKGRPGYGGHSRNELNSYYTFSAEGRDFLLLFLNIDLPGEDLAWAQRVLDEHPDTPVIVVTHLLMDTKGRLSEKPYVRKSKGNSPSFIYNEWIAKNSQIFMTVNGHYSGTYRTIRKNEAGLPVHQYTADYQGYPNGGEGFLRIIEFDLNKNTLTHRTYSPYLDEEMIGEQHNFTEYVDFEKRWNLEIPNQPYE